MRPGEVLGLGPVDITRDTRVAPLGSRHREDRTNCRSMSSSPSSGRVGQSLSDVLGFADEVRRYVLAGGEQHFYADRPTQLVAEAILHRIGEAVSRLPDEFTQGHPEVAWRQMEGMRNVVAHQYGFIDQRIVWRAPEEVSPRDIERITRLVGEEA